MFVSRSLDYALRSMIELAAHTAAEPLSLRQLGEATLVPSSYLAKVMRSLVRAELVQSEAGAHGGYRLRRTPDEISLREVYEAVEGAFHTVVCADGVESCELIDDCTQVSIWASLEREIRDLMAQRKLSDFLADAPAGPPAQGFVALRDVAAEH